MKVLTSFMKLPGKDKKLLIKTLLLMVKIRLMLWIMPFPRIQRSLPPVNSVKSDISVFKLVWSVNMISQYVPGTTCLTNALIGYSLLSRHGYFSLINIGVEKSSEGIFEAHAWLEYENKVVIGESEKEYVPLFDFRGVS